MLLYRWIKRETFMNREFSKYLWYAIGEILLVVAGIIIALQIDTWYDDKQSHERLDDYLENIAQSVADDIRRLQQLKSIRATTIFNSNSTFLATVNSEGGNTDWYNAALTASANAALQKAQEKLNFTASSGSYRALESSGLISKLSDTTLESMLYDYYRTVDRIAKIEEDVNNVIRELTLRFQTETARGLPQIFLREPLLLWQDGNVESENAKTLRERYWALLTDTVTQSLFRTTMNQAVMQEYEHLLSLGRQLGKRIGNELGDAGLNADYEGIDVYSADSPFGPPILLEAGEPEYHSYGVFTAPTADSSRFDHVYSTLWIEDNALNARYLGGQPWAYLYFKYGPIDIRVERITKDYSMYDRIRLEVKRDSSTQCSDLRLEIKDIDDAEKGGLRNVPLALTPEWQTYTVNLAEFVEADLTRLNVVAGFLFASPQPCSIAIRDVRYLRPE